MENKEKEAIEILEKYNQYHIVEYINKLNKEEKDKIINQILNTNFEEIIDLYKNVKSERKKRDIIIEPLQTIVANQLEENQQKEYIEQGEKVLRSNKYAVVTMAGGQGTRLRTQWTKGEL